MPSNSVKSKIPRCGGGTEGNRCRFATPVGVCSNGVDIRLRRKALVETNPCCSSVVGCKNSVGSVGGSIKPGRIQQVHANDLHCSQCIRRSCSIAGDTLVSLHPSSPSAVGALNIADAQGTTSSHGRINDIGIRWMNDQPENNEISRQPMAGLRPGIAPVERFPHSIEVGARVNG